MKNFDDDMSFEQFVARLENVKRNRDGSVTARCPAHNDRVSSLSAGPGTKQKIIAFCFAGCTFAEIMRAVRFVSAR